MEYSLTPDQHERYGILWIVLILILMEYSLTADPRVADNRCYYVLILILMEYSLTVFAVLAVWIINKS